MLFIFLISLKSKVRLLQDSWMGQTSVGRLHGRLDVLQTSFPPPPSWIQDGGAGNDVIQDLGRVFRSLLWRVEENGGPSASGRHLGWPHLREPEMRSPKMATGSGRAAIFLHPPQWGSKNAPYTTQMGEKFKSLIFELISQNDILSNSYERALVWIPQHLTDDNSTLVHVMAWRRYATSHYMSQCWHRSMPPFGVSRPQWVKQRFS